MKRSLCNNLWLRQSELIYWIHNLWNFGENNRKFHLSDTFLGTAQCCQHAKDQNSKLESR